MSISPNKRNKSRPTQIPENEKPISAFLLCKVESLIISALEDAESFYRHFSFGCKATLHKPDFCLGMNEESSRTSFQKKTRKKVEKLLKRLKKITSENIFLLMILISHSYALRCFTIGSSSFFTISTLTQSVWEHKRTKSLGAVMSLYVECHRKLLVIKLAPNSARFPSQLPSKFHFTSQHPSLALRDVTLDRFLNTSLENALWMINIDKYSTVITAKK